MSDSFFGDIGSAIGNVTNAIGETVMDIGGGIGSLLGGNVGTNPNTLMSFYRSQGIPPGAEANYYYSDVTAQFSSATKDKDWRVKIAHEMIYKERVFEPLVGTGGMVFPYLPTITMTHTANYEPISPAHTNYPIMAYKNSQVDDITIQGQFTVQSKEEAQYWLAMMHFLRTVTKMYFGQGPNLGNPPPICTLNGYGDFVYNKVPVVVKTFSINLDKDVDYISVQISPTGVRAGSGREGANVSYVPTMSNVTVTVAPVYSRDKMKSFNLTEFSKGSLVTAPDGKGFI